MASEDPLPDRCGARVVTKVGLEVHDDDADIVYTTEDGLESVTIENGAVQTDKPAEYEEVREYLHKGFVATEVVLNRSDGSDESVETVDVSDDDPYVTHVDTELDGYCERFPMDNGRCYVHGGANAGAPEGNTNGMKHGAYAKRSNYYNQLSDEDKWFVEALADSWIENSPFDKDNFAKVNEIYRIAIDQHRMWNAHDEFGDGLVYEQIIGTDDDGEPIEVEDENPVNLAYDRLDRTTVRKLKEYGALDDPESQKAEQMESLADKFAKLQDN